ncbi:hypothetical protein FA95DRAFT_1553953 [Auriscalpium vulgare]|uniref:Uncharacterized protein n=1 Tax=Auriscalpium vulgare TaxID=40419 RepID=A0ACB8S686_9AGAM|nr:hypothetical protein FA95DRAFT_1553953 [Auriscalpium vulgare]
MSETFSPAEPEITNSVPASPHATKDSSDAACSVIQRAEEGVSGDPEPPASSAEPELDSKADAPHEDAQGSIGGQPSGDGPSEGGAAQPSVEGLEGEDAGGQGSEEQPPRGSIVTVKYKGKIAYNIDEA